MRAIRRFVPRRPLAVLRRVSDDQPRPLREINPEVPSWLEALIARLMAKDPSDRYQTADEAFDVLKKCLAHVQQPLSSPLPAGLESRRDTSVRSKVLAAARCRCRSSVCAGAAIALTRYCENPPPEPGPAAERSDLSRSTRAEAWQGGPAADKIQQLIDQGRLMAEQTENDSCATIAGPRADSISARGFSC